MRPEAITRPLIPVLFAATLLAAPVLPWNMAGAPAGTAFAAVSADQWIHIRVDEHGPDGEVVRINLPLVLVEKLLPLVEKEGFRNGKLRTGRDSHFSINDRELTAAEMREIWQVVRTAPEGEFVSVTGRKEEVRVARQGAHLVIKAKEHDKAEGRNEDVEIRIPTAVMDALFSSGQSDELDLVAAVRALARSGGMELVAVDDDDSRVRIWVDTRHDSDDAGR